jgi:hypothetical protein
MTKGLDSGGNDEKREKKLCALAVAADAADGAAAFMFHNPAAIRTGAFKKGALLSSRPTVIGAHMELNGPSYRVGAGHYLVGQHLLISRSIAINCDAFTVQLIGQLINLKNMLTLKP